MESMTNISDFEEVPCSHVLEVTAAHHAYLMRPADIGFGAAREFAIDFRADAPTMPKTKTAEAESNALSFI